MGQGGRLQIGRLGFFEVVRGYYIYVGSAFGPGGLRARLSHHLQSTSKPHWHIDYLLQVARPVEIWCTVADQKLEHQWAGLLQHAPNFRVPIPRFGASDYHRSRLSHLYFSKRKPSFRWFEQRLSDEVTGTRARRFQVATDGRPLRPRNG